MGDKKEKYDPKKEVAAGEKNLKAVYRPSVTTHTRLRGTI